MRKLLIASRLPHCRSAPAASLPRRRQAQGRLHLCRAGRRFRLDLPARGRPAARSKRQFGDKVDDHLSRERQRGSGRGALDRAARARRPQADLHHLVRLHGPDDQGREEISERLLRARHRLQARQERRDLFRPLLRGPLHPGPDRRQDVEDRRARLHRLVPDPGGRSPASTPRCSARSRSTRTSRSRSSGSTPGSIRARKPTPPRRCSTRAPTS